MQLTEQSHRHPNLIKEADADQCVVGAKTFVKSVLIPWQGDVEHVDICSVEELGKKTFKSVAKLKPELLILATGEQIQYPNTDLLSPLLKENIGLEVMTNTAAARTFNVLMAENRQVVCLMLIA